MLVDLPDVANHYNCALCKFIFLKVYSDKYFCKQFELFVFDHLFVNRSSNDDDTDDKFSFACTPSDRE